MRGEKKYPHKPKDVPSNKSNTKNMPTLPYVGLQIDLGRQKGCLRGLSLACLCVSSHLNDGHSRGLNWAHSLSQNNLLHWDGQQNLQPCAYSCPETALPVLSPGQSISAEFRASSRGRKRARRTSPTRQKTREGILEWKEERTERSYNKTQTETRTLRTLYSVLLFSTEMQLQKFCYLATQLHIRIELISNACRGTTAFYKRSLREHALQVIASFIPTLAQCAVKTAPVLKKLSPSSLLSLLPAPTLSPHGH